MMRMIMLCDDVCHVPPLYLITSSPQASKLQSPFTLLVVNMIVKIMMMMMIMIMIMMFMMKMIMMMKNRMMITKSSPQVSKLPITIHSCPP